MMARRTKHSAKQMVNINLRIRYSSKNKLLFMIALSRTQRTYFHSSLHNCPTSPQNRFAAAWQVSQTARGHCCRSLYMHIGEPQAQVNSWICQTATATPAKPGILPFAAGGRFGGLCSRGLGDPSILPKVTGQCGLKQGTLSN